MFIGTGKRTGSRRCFAGAWDILSDAGPSNRQKGVIAMFARGICVLMLLGSICVPAQSQSTKNSVLPQGWNLAGSNPAGYETGLDPQTSYRGFPSAYLKARAPATDGFGTLMQEFNAGQYAGKRVRLTASVKAENVDDWAGLWMRVDKGSKAVSFDNMRDRPIKGTTPWQDYEVILDVPQDATQIAFGVLLSKAGAVWMSGVRFEEVGMDVPATGKAPKQLPDGPVNLNFEK
jgi:hypothetical protein